MIPENEDIFIIVEDSPVGFASYEKYLVFFLEVPEPVFGWWEKGENDHGHPAYVISCDGMMQELAESMEEANHYLYEYYMRTRP